LNYWEFLKDDPTKNELKLKVDANWQTISYNKIPDNEMTVIFSPRKGNNMLQTYADFFATANDLATITLPFNMDKRFEKVLADPSNAIRYVLLNSGKQRQINLILILM